MKKKLLIGIIGIISFTSCKTEDISIGDENSSNLIDYQEENGPLKSASGVSMPIGDLLGWQQILAEDFLTNASSASFGSTYAGAWTSYDDGGKYFQSTLSAHDGVMDFTLDGVKGAAGWFGSKYTTYGKFTMRIKAVNASDNGTAIMLWPTGNIWGNGEIDYPEGNFQNTLCLFHHITNCTDCSPSESYNTGVTWTNWHTVSVEWTSTSVKYYLDDVLIKTITHDIPINYHRYTVQVAPNGPSPQSGNFLIDWVTIYSLCPTCGNTLDNTDSQFVYNGTWTTSWDSGHYLGAEKESSTEGSTVDYTFTGTRARLYSYFGPWSGKCDVYVDNVYKTTVDQYNPTVSYQQLVYDTGTLPNGTHKVGCYVKHTKNASSGGYTVGVDKIVLY